MLESIRVGGRKYCRSGYPNHKFLALYTWLMNASTDWSHWLMDWLYQSNSPSQTDHSRINWLTDIVTYKKSELNTLRIEWWSVWFISKSINLRSISWLMIWLIYQLIDQSTVNQSNISSIDRCRHLCSFSSRRWSIKAVVPQSLEQREHPHERAMIAQW